MLELKAGLSCSHPCCHSGFGFGQSWGLTGQPGPGSGAGQGSSSFPNLPGHCSAAQSSAGGTSLALTSPFCRGYLSQKRDWEIRRSRMCLSHPFCLSSAHSVGLDLPGEARLQELCKQGTQVGAWERFKGFKLKEGRWRLEIRRKFLALRAVRPWQLCLLHSWKCCLEQPGTAGDVPASSPGKGDWIRSKVLSNPNHDSVIL